MTSIQSPFWLLLAAILTLFTSCKKEKASRYDQFFGYIVAGETTDAIFIDLHNQQIVSDYPWSGMVSVTEERLDLDKNGWDEIVFWSKTEASLNTFYSCGIRSGDRTVTVNQPYGNNSIPKPLIAGDTISKFRADLSSIENGKLATGGSTSSTWPTLLDSLWSAPHPQYLGLRFEDHMGNILYGWVHLTAEDHKITLHSCAYRP